MVLFCFGFVVVQCVVSCGQCGCEVFGVSVVGSCVHCGWQVCGVLYRVGIVAVKWCVVLGRGALWLCCVGSCGHCGCQVCGVLCRVGFVVSSQGFWYSAVASPLLTCCFFIRAVVCRC